MKKERNEQSTTNLHNVGHGSIHDSILPPEASGADLLLDEDSLKELRYN